MRGCCVCARVRAYREWWRGHSNRAPRMRLVHRQPAQACKPAPARPDRSKPSHVVEDEVGQHLDAERLAHRLVLLKVDLDLRPRARQVVAQRGARCWRRGAAGPCSAPPRIPPPSPPAPEFPPPRIRPLQAHQLDVRVVCQQLGDLGEQRAARAAPGRKHVHNHQLVGGLAGGAKAGRGRARRWLRAPQAGCHAGGGRAWRGRPRRAALRCLTAPRRAHTSTSTSSCTLLTSTLLGPQGRVCHGALVVPSARAVTSNLRSAARSAGRRSGREFERL